MWEGYFITLMLFLSTIESEKKYFNGRGVYELKECSNECDIYKLISM